jgi:benzoate-CoA ligase family protein
MIGGDEATLNLAAHFVDARIAEGLGSRPAIRTDDRLWTYLDVAALSSAFASVLAGADVRAEERVIIALPDGASFVGALFGILRRGAVVVMVNPELPADLLTYFFEYTRARAAFVHRAYLPAFEKATEALSPCPLVFVEDDAAFRHRLAVAPLDYPAFPTHRDDAAIWLFSGGTTGRPKAVVQPGRSFVNTTERYGHGVLGITADDITISVPKLFFGYALGSNVLFPFSKGASCVLFPERSTPEALFRQIKQHRPTLLINVPTMVQQMVNQAASGRHDLTSLRLSTSAGEALPAELLDRWRDAFAVELLDGLGTAEMWHIFLSNRPGACVPGTLGTVVDGFEVKLCDDDGGVVPDGEVGMLWVKGDSRALGYWRRLDDTARAFRGEWYVSGDMLQKNSDGTFTYCGRSDDMLKISGKWLSPGELENCLLQHEHVREAAVVGVKDDDGLVKPWAFVVCDQPTDETAAALQAFAKARLEPYKYPRKVVFVESLPRTHLGKVDRKELSGYFRRSANQG